MKPLNFRHGILEKLDTVARACFIVLAQFFGNPLKVVNQCCRMLLLYGLKNKNIFCDLYCSAQFFNSTYPVEERLLSYGGRKNNKLIEPVLDKENFLRPSRTSLCFHGLLSCNFTCQNFFWHVCLRISLNVSNDEEDVNGNENKTSAVFFVSQTFLISLMSITVMIISEVRKVRDFVKQAVTAWFTKCENVYVRCHTFIKDDYVYSSMFRSSISYTTRLIAQSVSPLFKKRIDTFLSKSFAGTSPILSIHSQYSSVTNWFRERTCSSLPLTRFD